MTSEDKKNLLENYKFFVLSSLERLGEDTSISEDKFRHVINVLKDNSQTKELRRIAIFHVKNNNKDRVYPAIQALRDLKDIISLRCVLTEVKQMSPLDKPLAAQLEVFIDELEPKAQNFLLKRLLDKKLKNKKRP